MLSPAVVLITLFLSSVYGQLNMKTSPKGNGGSTINVISGNSSPCPTINSEAQKRSENDHLTAISRAESTAQRVREEQRQRLIEAQKERDRIANAATATSKVDYYQKRYATERQGSFEFDERCKWGFMPEPEEEYFFPPEKMSALREAVREFLNNRHSVLKSRADSFSHDFDQHQKVIEYDEFDAHARYSLNHFNQELLASAANSNAEGDFKNAASLYDIAEFLLDTITTFTPGISTIRDLYEAIFGINLLTFRTISANERVIAAAMAFLPMKPTRIMGVMPKFEKLIKHKESFDQVRKLLYDKTLSEIKNTIAYIKKHKFYGENSDEMVVSIVNAFQDGAKIKVLEHDTKMYRYYTGEHPRGPWLTDKLIDNPHEKLALLHNEPVKVKEYLIPKGTEVLHGAASFQHTPYGPRWGGAAQFLVDKKILKDVP